MPITEKMHIISGMRAERYLIVLMNMVVVHMLVWHLSQSTVDDTSERIKQGQQDNHRADEQPVG